MSRRRGTSALTLLVLCSGCGALEGGEPQLASHAAALSTAFAPTSPLCPSTTDWSDWDQTPLSTWDDDVEPVVAWIIDRTGISCSTYSGHDPSIGRAADWRPHSRDEGTQLADWMIANTRAGGAPLGIRYIIWQAQIYLPANGVKPMENRYSFTQNHCDHIHISFVGSGSVSFDPGSVTPWGDEPPPDAGPPPDVQPAAVDAGPPVAPLLDAAAPRPPSAPDALVVAPPAPRQPAAPPSLLVGGCSATPRALGATTIALWPLLLLGLRAALSRRAGSGSRRTAGRSRRGCGGPRTGAPQARSRR